jgi:hypothetical protein
MLFWGQDFTATNNKYLREKKKKTKNTLPALENPSKGYYLRVTTFIFVFNPKTKFRKKSFLESNPRPTVSALGLVTTLFYINKLQNHESKHYFKKIMNCNSTIIITIII